MTLLYIIVFCLLGGFLSVLAASTFLLINQKTRTRILPHLVSFAIGSLLGAAFLGLLPHALESPYVTDAHDITLAVLIGLLSFFILEKMVLWRHCHSHECEVHGDDEHSHREHAAPAATLVIVGDSIHNFVDGVLIAAAFLTDINLGIVTALAVAAHEIPQEVGDFVILLNSGFSRSKALLFNLLTTLGTVVGGVLAYFMLQQIEPLIPYVLAVAASSFIYIAVADLIPSLHKRTNLTATFQQSGLIISGILLIYLAHSTLH
ncbi:Zinc transporter, ZIP family [hydrothermal vent metagenome]|uniref:Zinc transporter, ZIP family n=1 Tax=hydrothermal vent metagenome TaxID=652676 RepID=A0A3B0ZC06_9ZZZZ